VIDSHIAHLNKQFSCVMPVLTLAIAMAIAAPAGAQERLCDNSFEDCRTPILQMIQNETVGIDVSFWFMTDTRYSNAIIQRWQAGVPVRVLLDLRADANYPANATIRQQLIDAGIPIRHKTTTGINHWKMILYSGQARMHFSAANFANGSYSPVVPYQNYVDEAIYFTYDPAVVQTFMTKYDDLWTNTTHFANLANINGPLLRNYPTFPLDPAMNFPPDQDYQDRLVAQARQETERIDVIMFRITSGKVPDELLLRRQAGVPIRIITDKDQYRNTTYFWHSYNIDRMYAAGIPVKWRRDDATSDEDMHQKSVVLYSRDMAVFGSSNWTSASSDTQREHNYFTNKTWFVDWFKDQFSRKWNNLRVDGTPMSPEMYLAFDPGWPEAPVNISPANGALGLGTSVPLKWEGGWWAHKYDIYFGTTNPPPLIASDFMPGSSTAGVVSSKETFNPCAPPAPFTSVCPGGLAAGTTYYWKVRGKTMLGNTRAITGPIWSFTTSGGVPPPPAPTGLVATTVSSSRIDLSWTDVAGESGYKIERKLASSSTWAQIATTGADVTTYQNTSGLTPSTQYNYRVRAWTTGGNSGYSNTATATTTAASPEAGRILADTYVRAGQYASTNYGTATELIAKFSADGQYHRQSFLKLDISQVQPTTTSVVLRLAAKLSDTRAASVTVNLYAGTDTSWSETAMTWNNKPSVPTNTGASVVASGTTAQWRSIDLTTFIKQQRALGFTAITIALISPVDTLPYASFGSRESSTRPELIITP
jgi:phosphatidylserine/phosphatidylglycerophosphate/cardiolipin synthase-like enzyme